MVRQLTMSAANLGSLSENLQLRSLYSSIGVIILDSYATP